MIGVMWNACGLGGQRAFWNLARLFQETSPDFYFISESRIYENAAVTLKIKLGFANVFCVKTTGSKEGLLLFWNENVNLSILSYSIGYIEFSSVSLLFYGFLRLS